MAGTEGWFDNRKPLSLHQGRNYFGAEPGAHTIRVTRDGYDPVERKVELKKGVVLPLPVVEWKPLVRTASLGIEDATREAEVLVDGTSRGNVSGDGVFKLGDLSPGEHTITLRKANFEDKTLSKVFSIGQTVRLFGGDGQLTP